MWHTIVIAVHAAAGGIALLAGCLALARPALGRRVLFGTYLWSLVAVEVFLVVAIAGDWARTDVTARVLFAAFAVLGLVMIWRGAQAHRIRPRGTAGLSADYVTHVGFTLVALVDAFIVILVLDLGAPLWLVVSAGVLIAVAGHFVLRAVAARLVAAVGLAG